MQGYQKTTHITISIYNEADNIQYPIIGLHMVQTIQTCFHHVVAVYIITDMFLYQGIRSFFCPFILHPNAYANNTRNLIMVEIVVWMMLVIPLQKGFKSDDNCLKSKILDYVMQEKCIPLPPNGLYNWIRDSKSLQLEKCDPFLCSKDEIVVSCRSFLCHGSFEVLFANFGSKELEHFAKILQKTS